MLADPATAPIPDAEKALFAFLQKVTLASTQVERSDLDALRAVGWSDEALYDAITVCALFQFYNTWIDATGVHDMPAEAYAMSGKRMAELGYAISPPAP